MGTNSSRYAESKITEVEEALQSNKEQSEYLQNTFNMFENKLQEMQKKNEKEISKFEQHISSNKTWCGSIEKRLAQIEKELAKLDNLAEVKEEITRLEGARVNYEIKLPTQVKNIMENENKSHSTEIIKLKQTFEELQTYAAELATNSLNHERELKEIKTKISQSLSTGNNNECKYHTYTLTGCKCETNKADSWTNNLSPQDVNSELEVVNPEDCTSLPEERSNYEFRYSKINKAVEKLKSDIKYAEIRCHGTEL